MARLNALQKTAFADFHEGYLSRYIALADTKAGVALTINAGLLGFMATRSEWWSAAKADTVVLALLLANGLVPIAAGAWSLWTIMPRRSKSSEGLIFWRSVRSHPSENAYISAVEAVTPAALARERLSHSWALAGVAEKKYDHLFWSLLLTAAAVLITVGHLLFSTLSEPAQKPTMIRPDGKAAAAPSRRPAPSQSTPPQTKPALEITKGAIAADKVRKAQ
jgi:Family of unknown function (DUF5706)